MKIVVVSDNHGKIDDLDKVRMQENNVDIFLHCGDSQLPEQLIYPFSAVHGNCDYFDDYPQFRIVPTPYGNIYIEHGNRMFPMSVEMLKEKGCIVYIQGHTHKKKLEKIEDCYFVNPGSISRPRDGNVGTYLVINATKENIEFIFKTI